MPTTLRSPSKINLGLAIGPIRPDGFHALTTLYQTLALHDLLTLSATPAAVTRLTITSNHLRVPLDRHNTAWKMVSLALDRLGISAEVTMHIEKRLPIQGGLGAGSANAAVALVALERELALHGVPSLPGSTRLRLAAQVGSDVPLFLIGGAVLGQGRGELVTPLPDLPRMACVLAIPAVGVSTPAAFRAWDMLALTQSAEGDRLQELSLGYAASFAKQAEMADSAETGSSGIFTVCSPERKQGESNPQDWMMASEDLRENPLLSLVRTGMENDFEEVVFEQHPPLRSLKHMMMGLESASPALYAAMSGSGSALFGLFRSKEDACLAQQRIQSTGTEALLTETLPRSRYWSTMVAKDV